MPDLPLEIISDILSRLPAKTLVKFRCVSKSWRSLISDPHFTKNHLHRISTIGENYNNNCRIIANCDEPGFGFKSHSISSFYTKNPSANNDAIMKLAHPFKTSHPHDHLVVGCCNGLLCLADADLGFVYLWNPTTRESCRRLPYSGVVRGRKNCYIAYGFGYDCSTDDYKVVEVVTCSVLENYEENENEVKVYSMRTDSWRRIEGFPFGTPLVEPGSFVGGAVHWPAVRLSSSDHEAINCAFRAPNLRLSWNIVAFVLETETYQEVPQPMYEDSGYDRILGILGKSLCVLAKSRQRNHAVLWVMEEYGVQESWTKLLTISEHLSSCRPLFYSEDDILLLELGSFWVMYHPEDDAFRCPVFGISSNWSCLNSKIYVESLVSPNANDMVERQHP